VKKFHVVVAASAMLLALLSVQQQSYAQYAGTGTEVSEETLQKCQTLQIEKAQCTESNVLARERVGLTDGAGSGTAFLAKESGQMITLIGVLGALFGGVAGAFFLMGKGKQVKEV
jgi:hypothetical protein